jgi:two-component system, LuxR family, response regulator FixJ
MMTGQGDVQSAVRAMRAGAVDFIEKPYSDDALFKAIKAALARVGRANIGRETVEAAERIATLSPHEREVLDALVAGRPYKVIAFDLGISVRTVEVHRAHDGRSRRASICTSDTPRGLGALRLISLIGQQ